MLLVLTDAIWQRVKTIPATQMPPNVHTIVDVHLKDITAILQGDSCITKNVENGNWLIFGGH